MKLTISKEKIRKLVEQRNGYMVIALVLSALCLLLVLLCFDLVTRERTIVAPPVIKQAFWVTDREVSSEYLSQMTEYFAYLRLNITPDSADYQRESLLRYVDPRYYGVLKDELVAERDRIVQQHVSIAFYPSDVEVDTTALSAIIVGDLISNVGTTQLTPQRVAYQLKYRYVNGRLLVTQFEEVKPHG